MKKVILIIIIGLAIYANSLDGKFLWDDYPLIVNNPLIKSWSNVKDIFTKDIGAGAGFSYGYNRPLLMLTLMADYSLWGLGVKGYHFTTVSLHIATALAVYWLITILFGKRPFSFITALLFLTHPIQCEDVAYITGRADSLVFLFMLLSLISYILCVREGRSGLYAAALASYAIAVLSKENGLILPIIILIYHFAFKKRFSVKLFLPFAVIALFFIMTKLMIAHATLPYTRFIMGAPARLPGFFVALTNYIKIAVLPLGLHMAHGKKIFTFADWQAITGILLFIFAIWLGVLKKGGNALMRFSALWFLVTIIPVSNILYPATEYMANRYLYIPSLGLFLPAAYGLTYLYTSKRLHKIGICLTAGLLLSYSILTIRENTYWKDPIIFYERTLRHAPDNPVVLSNLATEYRKTGRIQKAVEYYERALIYRPDYVTACYNLARVYNEIGRKEEAERLYRKVIKLNPRHAASYNNLATLMIESDRMEEAIQLFEKAVAIEPANPSWSLNLERALREREEKLKRLKKEAL